MQKFNQPVRQLLNRAQRRFVRSRPGSVLILVVALLILMAVIGTAFMSMAQADRSTAVIHSNNTEVDLLIDGLVNLVKSTIVGDLFVQGNYRPVNRYNTGEPNTYNYTTGLGEDFVSANPGTKFVASRAPELLNELGGYLSGSANPDAIVNVNNAPMWRYITAPLFGGQFSSPVQPQHVVNTPFLVGETWAPNAAPWVYSERASIPGSFGSFTFFPGAMPGTGMPAWVDNPQNPQRFFPAADADGDGIADAGYIKLPMGAVNGVTYYAAVRIIDNNGAVNANTAWQHNTVTTGTAAPVLPGDFFTSNIDLLDLLHPTDQNTASPTTGFNLLLDTRFNRSLGSSPYPTQSSSALAYNDDGTQRTDFSYATLTEAQFMGLNRRMKNPGIAASSGAANIFYQPLSINESLTMARNYVLRDPGVTNSSLSPALLEQYLPFSTSVQSSASSIPYTPDFLGVSQWYLQNFSHYASFITNQFASFVNSRPMLTSENAESEFAPSKFRDLGHISADGPTWAPTAPDVSAPANGYRFGDTVVWNKHRYVCINPLGASGGGLEGIVAPTAGSGVPQPNFGAGYRYVDTTPDGLRVPTSSWAIDNDTWVYMPWTTNPTKISANSGTFGQLMLAFWSVMAEKQNSTPNVAATDRIWEPPFPVNQYNLQSLDSPRMFRSPMRLPHAPGGDVGLAWRLSPPQVMQLRAAIAAVNAIDMRDSDDSVTARNIHLFDPDTNTQPNPLMRDVIATVYGSERQPFITKVYATNSWTNTGDPTTTQHGYIAIELFNPDPVRPMSLSGWALGTILRYPPGTTPSVALPPNLTPVVVPFDAADPPWIDSLTSKAPVIPPLGSIVIASTDTPPNGVTLPPTVVKPDPITGALPAAGDTALYIVKNLVPPGPVTGAPGPWGALGTELMLFRPRVADPVTGAGILSAWIGLANTSPPVGAGPLQLIPTGATDTANANPWPYYYEGMVAGGVPTPNPADMVPVDSYDFSGLNTLVADPGGIPPTEWYYVRPNDFSVAGRKAWHWVYPGHYAYDLTSAGPTYLPRLIDGTWSSDVPTPGGGLNAATTLAGITAGTPIPFGIAQITPKAEYRDIPLVLNTTDFAGPNTFRRSDTSGASVGYPYGGFARNGDVMNVPFIGSYRLAIQYPVSPNGTLQVLEINPATMDSVMALGLSQPTWGEPVENVFTTLPQNAAANTIGGDAIFDTGALTLNAAPLESVGRFAPISFTEFTGAPATPVADFAAPTTVGGVNPFWLYHFATRLFDYVTVQSPQQDYVPDVDPGVTDPAQDPSTGFKPMLNVSFHLKFTAGASTAPFPVANTTLNIFNAEPSNLNAATEETSPKTGLVNVNTAPWRVLASVPWVPPNYPLWGSDDGNRIRTNVNIALSIARYRDVDDGTGTPLVSGGPTIHGHGPFKNIYELLDVPVYPFLPSPLPSNPTLLRNILKVAPYAGPLPSAYTPVQGVLSPAYFGINPAPVYGDFQSKYIMMNRISNLVTTRSDSFTAYVLIEGWQDPETSQAKRVVSRRTSFLIDRTGVTPISRDPTVTFIPSNQ